MTQTFRERWVVCYHSSNDRKVQALLDLQEIKYKEFLIYGTIRAFLLSLGISTNETVVWHGTNYIGNYEQLQNYLSGKGKTN